MSTVKLEISLDACNPLHVEALTSFLTIVGNHSEMQPSIKKLEKVKVIDAKNVTEEVAAESAKKPEAVKEETKTEPTVKLEDIRAEMALKIDDNREAIKDKMIALNTNNLTKLKPEDYEVFLDFLKAL